MTIQTIARSLAALVACGLVVVPGPTGASATAAPTTAAAAADADNGRLLLLLDSSGSMKEPAAGGTTKIEAARDALSAVVDGLPDDADVGLRVFGATVFSRTDAGACQDTQLVVPPGTGNRDELRSAVTGYEPYGETPIPAALRAAAADLGGEGHRSIVLVSDGESTCDPDPCQVAKEITAQGIDLKVDVVGLSVSGKARRQLRCIAANGGGAYYDADDAGDITESLTDAAQRATRPFGFTGTPVEGTVDVATAPVVATGQYLDKVPASGTRYYRFERSAPATTLHLGAVFQGEAEDLVSTLFAKILVEEDGDLRECGSALLQGVSAVSPSGLINDATTSAKSDPEDACNTADELVLSVEPSHSDAIGGKPLQLMVYEEPAVSQDALADLPPEADDPGWTEPTAADPQDGPLPGDTLESAPVVTPGSYRFDVNPGENQVVGVPVGWGQHVVARFDARLTDAIRSNWGADAGIDLEVISPLGGDATVDLSTSEEPDTWCTGLILGCPDAWVDGVVSHPIAYRNRFGDLADRATSVPGIHYVQVRYSLDEPINVPYTLTIDVVGDEVPAPAYDDAKGVEPPAADSRLVTAAGDSGSDGDTTDPSNPGDSADSGEGTAPAAADDGSSAGRLLAAGGVGLLGLGALGAAVVLLSRRRRG